MTAMETAMMAITAVAKCVIVMEDSRAGIEQEEGGMSESLLLFDLGRGGCTYAKFVCGVESRHQDCLR